MRRFGPAALMAAFSALALLLPAAPAHSQSDQGADHIWIVTIADDPGPARCTAVCSLRAAITAANDSPGSDSIRFAIVGPTTIRPRFALPALSGAAISLDARTQPGWRGGAPPVIYLDGANAGAAAGIIVRAPDAQIRGLAIGGFAHYGIGLIGAAAVDAVIELNWLGMTADGLVASPNRLSGAAVLGGAVRAVIISNRIAGNSTANRTGHGVLIGGGGTMAASVADNIIGLNAADRPLANDDGVLIVDSAQADVRGNTICASRVAGVEVRGTRAPSSIDGNRIGASCGGVEAGNNLGVFIGPGAARVKIGALEPNTIAANRVGVGVEQGAREVQLQGNWIGLIPNDEMPAAADALPNRERGISVIAGAAEVMIVNNQILAGERGIVVEGPGTSRVSLQRNVIASGGQTLVGVELRGVVEAAVGGGKGLGNDISGADIAILLEHIEEARVVDNRIGSEFAGFPFAPDSSVEVGIELGAGVRSAAIQENRLGGMSGAAIAVTGADAGGNLLTRNVFGSNGGLDIDLGGDGPTLNDPGDFDIGPHGLLNAPVLTSYEVEYEEGGHLRSRIRGTGAPGTMVEVSVQGPGHPGWYARGQVRPDGGFEAVTLEIPLGDVRAVSVSRGGATSEFSAALPAPRRQPLSGGDLSWVAFSGGEQLIADALKPFAPYLIAAWHLDSASGQWEVWAPEAPPHLSTLNTVQGGDLIALRLRPGAPDDFFSETSANTVGRELQLRAGLNAVSWTGLSAHGLMALAKLDAAEPGLLSTAWQWVPKESRWRVIWPRRMDGYDPGIWGAPALVLRTTRAGIWRQSD